MQLNPDLLHCLPSFQSAAEFLFPSHVLKDPAQVATRSFLSPLNKYVDEFNDYMLDHLDVDIGMFQDLLIILIFLFLLIVTIIHTRGDVLQP